VARLGKSASNASIPPPLTQSATRRRQGDPQRGRPRQWRNAGGDASGRLCRLAGRFTTLPRVGEVACREHGAQGPPARPDTRPRADGVDRPQRGRTFRGIGFTPPGGGNEPLRVSRPRPAASSSTRRRPGRLPKLLLRGARPRARVVVRGGPCEERLDAVFHVRMVFFRRVAKRRNAEDVGLCSSKRRELIGVGVDAEVEHLEAGALEQSPRVLADVVRCRPHRADHDLADRLHTRFRGAAAAGSPCPPSFALEA